MPVPFKAVAREAAREAVAFLIGYRTALEKTPREQMINRGILAFD